MEAEQAELKSLIENEMQHVVAYEDAEDKLAALKKKKAALEEQARTLKGNHQEYLAQIAQLKNQIDNEDFSNLRLSMAGSGLSEKDIRKASSKIAWKMGFFNIGVIVAGLVLGIFHAIALMISHPNQMGYYQPSSSTTEMLMSILPVYIAWFLIFWWGKHHDKLTAANQYMNEKSLLLQHRIIMFVFSIVVIPVTLTMAGGTSNPSQFAPVLIWAAFFFNWFGYYHFVKKAQGKVEAQVSAQQEDEYQKKVAQSKAALAGLKEKIESQQLDLAGDIQTIDGDVQTINDTDLPKMENMVVEVKNSLPKAIDIADQYRYDLGYYQFMLEAVATGQAKEVGKANELATNRIMSTQQHEDMMGRLGNIQADIRNGFQGLNERLDGLTGAVAAAAQQQHEDLRQLDISVQSGFSTVEAKMEDSTRRIESGLNQVTAAQMSTTEEVRQANESLRNIDANSTQIMYNTEKKPSGLF